MEYTAFTRNDRGCAARESHTRWIRAGRPNGQSASGTKKKQKFDTPILQLMRQRIERLTKSISGTSQNKFDPKQTATLRRRLKRP